MADGRAEKAEQFGEHWPAAQAVLRVLETYGVVVIDVNTNNIAIGATKR